MSSQETQKFMANWVAAIADNVKNPIASVGAVLDHAEAHLTDALIVSESISQIRKRLLDLNEYVTELSNFSRPVLVLAEPLLVKSWIHDSVHAARLPADCIMEIDVPENYRIYADIVQLKFTLKAILRNAFEAVNARDTPHILISASDDADCNVVLSVEDNGPGLGPTKASDALQPFFTTKEAGTGLGLAIARKYVLAHKGRLEIVRSRRLGGCCVILTLPIRMPKIEEI